MKNNDLYKQNESKFSLGAKKKDSNSLSVRPFLRKDTKILKGCKYNRARGLKPDLLAVSERIF